MVRNNLKCLLQFAGYEATIQMVVVKSKSRLLLGLNHVTCAAWHGPTLLMNLINC